MAIVYKIDVLAELKKAGYTSYRIRQEKLMGERTLQQFRYGDIASPAVLSKLCELLHCQPGDILEYVSDDQMLTVCGGIQQDPLPSVESPTPRKKTARK